MFYHRYAKHPEIRAASLGKRGTRSHPSNHMKLNICTNFDLHSARNTLNASLMGFRSKDIFHFYNDIRSLLMLLLKYLELWLPGFQLTLYMPRVPLEKSVNLIYDTWENIE